MYTAISLSSKNEKNNEMTVMHRDAEKFKMLATKYMSSNLVPPVSILLRVLETHVRVGFQDSAYQAEDLLYSRLQP